MYEYIPPILNLLAQDSKALKTASKFVFLNNVKKNSHT